MAFGDLGNIGKDLRSSVEYLSEEGLPMQHEVIIDKPTAVYLIAILVIGILIPLLIYAFTRAYADSYFKNKKI